MMAIRKTGVGKKPTIGIFKEFHQELSAVPVVYTIAEEDDGELKSFPKIFYKHYKDPTEMSLVKEVFNGDIDIWESIKQAAIFRPYYETMRKKADMMLMSDAYAEITRIAFDDTNRNNFTALKYLVDRGTKTATATTRGRPKKNKDVETVDTSDLAADIARLGA